MSGAISLLPKYAFMAWCTVKKSTRTTLTLARYVISPKMFTYFILLISKYFHHTLSSDTCNLCSILTVRNHVSHPRKTIFCRVYFLTFSVLKSRPLFALTTLYFHLLKRVNCLVLSVYLSFQFV